MHSLHRAVVIVCALVAVGVTATQFSIIIVLAIQDGRGVGGGVWTLMAYFTNWGNLAVAIVSSAMALGMTRSLGGPRAVLVVLPSIVVISASYNLLLVGTLSEVSEFRQWVRMSMHDIVPPLFVLLFFTAPHRHLLWRDAAWALPLPLTYAVYSLIRGLYEDWFPYWFLDLTRLPPLDFVRNTILFIIAFYVLGLIVVALDRGLSRLYRSPTG